MTKHVEDLKFLAEDNGIESITYEEQAKIAAYLLEEHRDLDKVCQWFNDRYVIDYPRERTVEHLRRIADLTETDMMAGV